MDVRVSASMLYDLVSCEHRPWMDLHADRALRDPVNPFVEMLWRRGRMHEDELVREGAIEAPNLRETPIAERAGRTLACMRAGVPLIYGGRLEVDDLVGEPDLLRLEAGGYVPGDIKSGSGEEGRADDRRPKKEYAVQLALYVDALERLGFGAGRRAFVWDVDGEEVAYDLSLPKGPRTPSTFWDDYGECLARARATIAGADASAPAYSATCKLCVWRSACLATLERGDDLTLIPGLGRSKREPLLPHVPSITALASAGPGRFLDGDGKSVVKGLGPDTLRKFHARAVLRSTHGHPYLTRALRLPQNPVELFFDVETDPLRNHCYLHGFVERRVDDPSAETYTAFFSAEPTEEAEREAFAAAWAFVRARRPCTIYIYSKYERTWWRQLQQRHPDVCTADEVAELFGCGDVVDLYEVVETSSEWPTVDHSIKTLASYLGFAWRDPHPSGAASIQWYESHLEGAQDAKQRILDYNEDDCRATRILIDALRTMRVAAA
ncbi:MAG TPA: TM0106 family RecB-like putative nuclease [Candidatus Baltobacteraceae bacterium]|nr:TM0106 family RecB-like putative nuclease [Candidatus Baltobacteraceae bacterium]